MSLASGYEQLWKAIIRPPRAKYRQQMLGHKLNLGGLKIQRTQIQLINKQGLKLKCSHYQPYIRPCKQLPCVIYLHGNSSCQFQGRGHIPQILCHDITLFTFDFAGCGNSEGQYISLGYYEKDDVDVVFHYLRSLGTVSSIGLWGRSMGAVTALMYADTNHQIACIVCDSPFSNLQELCKQLAGKYTKGIVSFFSGIALSFIAKTIKEKNGLDISKLDPLGKHVKKAFIPAFFIAAKDDDFISPKHSQKLYKEYAGQKLIRIVQGNHNSQRGQQVNEAISVFFYNNLHVQRLVRKDKEFIEQQKKIKSKQKNFKEKFQNSQNFQNFQSEQQKMLKQAIRLSLEECQFSTKSKNQPMTKKKQEQNLMEKDIEKKRKQQQKNIQIRLDVESENQKNQIRIKKVQSKFKTYTKSSQLP